VPRGGISRRRYESSSVPVLATRRSKVTNCRRSGGGERFAAAIRAPSWATSERGESVLCQFHLSSGKLDQAAPCDRQVEWHPGELNPRAGFIVTDHSGPAERVVAFYNKAGTCEQRIKEGNGAIKWTRLSCRTSQPTPYDSRFMRSRIISAASAAGWRLPSQIKDWSLTILKEKLVKIGTKVGATGALSFRWRTSPSNGKCSRRFCG
jgi:hypothetical protein